ncbi:MAG: hypothetical protein IKQ97_04100 [Eubacterium sp.]|nr:hypothetical protein [Eubacterium sp.]
MNDSIEMIVSPITHDGNGKPQVFVEFRDGDKKAEGRIPGGRVISSTGFTDDEVKALEGYMKNEKATILSTAKRIDVMASFLGK